MKIFRSMLVGVVVAVTFTVGVASGEPPSAPSLSAGGKIDLQGAINVRDVGGYRTYDGATVKADKVIRADALQRLTDADVARLGSLNLGTVIDLRTPAEVRMMGADRLPAGVVSVARPIDDTGLFEQMTQVIQSRDPVEQQRVLGDGGAERIMGEVYRSFFTDDARTKFGQTITELAATDSAMLYHCTAGKDRTGWLTYVVLRAVGVPESVARQDYLLSNRYRAAADAALRAQLRQAGVMQNPDLLIPLQEVRDEYLDIAVRQLEQTYGGFGKYLTEGLGLDPLTILRLRKNLVG
ncbi:MULTISPECIES: tyrosine-protein phosphatase [unclassified Nocardia]|uniref:tyrosine-protein phosphatase n=1 Tax=unclassified Nocardia TaxID=2637762 RepID=UPI001CE49DBF|nr:MULTISPECIES: tyrosine-protein phosphatase [unclassified Nocardia]